MTEVFYILVNNEIVVAHPNGEARIFSKLKKAKNFINGRPYLKKQVTQIVTDISNQHNRLKIDI